MKGKRADLFVVDDVGAPQLTGPAQGAWWRKVWSQPLNHGPKCRYEVYGHRLALVCRCPTPHTTPRPKGSKGA